MNDVLFPRAVFRDNAHLQAHLQPKITQVITNAELEGICHGLSVREVLSIWAKGETINETNSAVVKMARLGRA